MTIPDNESNLHFVWFGKNLVTEVKVGKDKASGGNIDRLVTWAKANPDYEINLWTDANSFSSVEKELKRRADLDPSFPKNIKVRNFDKHFSFSHEPSKRNKLLELISFFRDPLNSRQTPNHAAASDIARSMILEECGGIYLDLDTEPMLDSETKLVKNPV